MIYKELSNSEILNSLDSELSKDLIFEAISRKDFSITSKLNELNKQHSFIGELVSELGIFPEEIIASYYPNRDVLENSLDLPLDISSIDTNPYKDISAAEDFNVKLRLKKDANSINKYNQVENKSNTKVKSLIMGNILAFSTAFTLAIQYNNFISDSANIANNTVKIQSSAQVSHFNEIFQDAVLELAKGGFDLRPLAQLSNHDVQLLYSLADNQEEAENFEPSEDELLATIQESILPHMEEGREYNPEFLKTVAHAIHEASKNRQIDYLLFLSILKVETTTFSQSKVSHTGDISIAQIKPEVWADEFIRLKREPLDLVRLKKDAAYAIDRMGEILEILKKSAAKKDPLWYARYNSKTPSKKLIYAQKVQEQFTTFREKQIEQVDMKISAIINDLNNIEQKSPEVSIAYLKQLTVNFDKIDRLKAELTHLQSLITINQKRMDLAVNNPTFSYR